MGLPDQGKATRTQLLNNGLNFTGDGAAEGAEVAPASRKLRRLPHVFCKLLELPFAVDTPVVVEERKECYAFVIRQPGLQKADVVTEAVQIVPGAIKVTLRGADRIRAAGLEKNPAVEMVGNWRARLPACTVPEAATATYTDGIITIIIPKLLPAARHSPCPSSGCAPQDMKRSLLCSNA
eukprot:c4357_g1_i1 orf=99-638(-)